MKQIDLRQSNKKINIEVESKTHLFCDHLQNFGRSLVVLPTPKFSESHELSTIRTPQLLGPKG